MNSRNLTKAEMEQTDYTEEQLEGAKSYLRSRLRNQQSMSRRIEELILLYAEYMLNALFSSMGGNVEADIELLIADLIEQIWNDCVLLAEDEHDRNDLILAYISREIAGDNLHGRIEKRVRTLAAEITAVYAAGKVLTHSYAYMLSSIKEYRHDPWKNPILVEAREMRDKGVMQFTDIDLDEPHYGQGIAISSLTALDWMTENAIAEGWMYWKYLDEKDKGAVGYFRERMSSYDCPLCDEWCGIFYPISDTEHMGLRHVHCVCAVVYSYVDRL